MKKSLLFIIFLLGFFAYAQEIQGYESGELLIQIDPDSNPHHLVRSLESKNNVDVRKMDELSDIASIYCIVFEDKSVDLNKMTQLLYSYPDVWVVQKNHFVTVRETIPNDTEFNEQWHLKNDGSTGGTADADIDATNAWETTTGGSTTHSDEIVVCIIEGGGVDIWHEDLIDNIWINTEEVHDGLDNDGNGYVDDSLGWNVAELNDEVGAGSHGTRVSGMVGAKGNNSIGVSGVNWDVKMMIVKGQTASNEASVIAAYNYPLKMRKMYNESYGEEGAFVVVTNSSWGIDNGDPEDAPLWCAMYDSMGVHGILSVAATTNSNSNVDDVGDLPTTCSSDYLISATMTNSDDIRAGSGYGTTHIDLGAPGSNVMLTQSGDSYTTTSGTSFASPCVAGAVALAYSTPCADFINFVKYNPSNAALIMKDYVLDNVDPITALSSEVLSGGRLNVNNTINAILDDCDTNSCNAPYSLRLTNLTDSIAEFSWDGFSSNYIVYLSENGDPFVSYPTTSGTSFDIDTLNPCTNYTIKIKALCPVDDDTSIFSYPLTFTTDGCCNNPPIALQLKTENELTVDWEPVLYATQYDMRYRKEGTSGWSEFSDVSSPVTISGLEACTKYEFQIYTLCADSTHGYSESTVYGTLGCGACTEKDYCEISGANDNLEWIDSVAINGYLNQTGANGGWLISPGIITALTPGESYDLRIVPGYESSVFTENFSVWVDFDHSGSFETAEKVIDDAVNNGPVEETIDIPLSATIGVTRMRIGMSALSSPEACHSANFWGEFEDYCVYIGPQTGIEENTSEISIYPNPVIDQLYIQSDSPLTSVKIFTQDGKVIYDENGSSNVIPTSHLSKGIYIIFVSTEKGVSNHKFLKH